jgi:hypothetical protein
MSAEVIEPNRRSPSPTLAVNVRSAVASLMASSSAEAFSEAAIRQRRLASAAMRALLPADAAYARPRGIR